MTFCWGTEFFLNTWLSFVHQVTLQNLSLSDTGVFDLRGGGGIWVFNCLSSTLWMQCCFFWAGSFMLLMCFHSWEPAVLAPASLQTLLAGLLPIQTLSQSLLMELCHCHGIVLQLRAILSFLLYSQNYNSPPLMVAFLGNMVFILFLFIRGLNYVWYLFILTLGQFCWLIFLDALLGSALFLPPAPFYYNFSYFLHCDRDTVIVLTVLADVCDCPKCCLTPADFFLLFLV